MNPLFDSFFLGGFECSTHRRKDGERLDLIEATQHDRFVAQDYMAMRDHGIKAVRDGVRWHKIERAAGEYDWSSFLPMLHAAEAAGVQPIWDLCHYGWPDDIDIWSGEFVDRFARFAAALARVIQGETDRQPWYCPVNEISFWAWAGGDMALFNPGTTRRGMELKCQLVRAAIAAVDAVRSIDARAGIVHVDPVIHVLPKTPRYRAEARHAHDAQYEAWDMLAGTVLPELGGGPGYVDVVGVNYYSDNQWFLRGTTIARESSQYRPFRNILADVHARYQRPLFVAETGAENEHRAPWLRYIGDEVQAARETGVPVGGICLYPITDYPGWADQRHCHAGLLGFADAQGLRPVHQDLADELQRQQLIFAPLPGASTFQGFATRNRSL